MTKTSVLIVEDSLTTRKRLRAVVESTPGFRVVAEAVDGRQAIELCQRLRPAVITMDMMLPVMTGLGATEYIMAHCPTPILVVSSSFNRGEVFRTYDALAAGAVDVIEKPTGQEREGEWEAAFLRALRIVSRVRVITHVRARLGRIEQLARSTDALPASAGIGAGSRQTAPPRAVLIGASTGGPGALVEVLGALPEDFSTPVLVVLHISVPFAAAFCDWLGAQCDRPVAYARDGELLDEARGRILLAPLDRHLTVRHGRLRLTNEAERHSCRPSVDVLFESAAEDLGETAIGCLLTGMGRDGAEGCLKLRQRGALTIAQDEATSVVFGMPQKAIEIGGASLVLPLGEIASTLRTLTAPSRSERQ